MDNNQNNFQNQNALNTNPVSPQPNPNPQGGVNLQAQNTQMPVSPENNPIVNSQPVNNQYIQDNVNYNNTKLAELNVDGTYNNLNKDIYAKNTANPQINNAPQKKKVTIKITKEAKVFILIIIFMFVFILLMPSIFELIEKIKFH